MRASPEKPRPSAGVGGAPSGRKARLPLFVVLLGAVLLVTLAPFVIFSSLTMGEMKEALVVAQHERQLDLAGSMAQRLDAFLAEEGRQAVKLGETIASTIPAQGTRVPFMPAVLDDTVVFASFRPLSGERQSAQARDLVVPTAMLEALERDAASLIAQGPSAQPPARRSAYLGDLFQIGPERILAVTVTAPVQREGRLLGVYQEIVLFQAVWSGFATSVPASSTIYLLSPEGNIVAHRGAGSAIARDQVLDREIVEKFRQARGVSRGTLAYQVGDGEGGERRYLGAFASTSNSWCVIVEVDEALAFAPVEQMTRKVALGGAIAAGLALVVTIFLGAMISRPITRLADVSTRLAQGDFAVAIRPSRVRELDDLAHNFDRMAQRLGDLVERFRAAARDANALFLGTIRALAEAIDEKDPYTKGHSVRVNRYAVIIGRYLGLPKDDLRDLHVSSLLHDVGKIGIDDAILKKPAALTPDEYEVMKSHPGRGAKIMDRIPQMKAIIPGMRFHHERWAGGGYPKGLKGPEIPLQARIIAVADTFDAMTTDRPYQKSFDVAEAVSRINDLKGIGFDPEIVEAFNRAFEAGELDEVLSARPRIVFLGDTGEDTGNEGRATDAADAARL